ALPAGGGTVCSWRGGAGAAGSAPFARDRTELRGRAGPSAAPPGRQPMTKSTVEPVRATRIPRGGRRSLRIMLVLIAAFVTTAAIVYAQRWRDPGDAPCYTPDECPRAAYD